MIRRRTAVTVPKCPMDPGMMLENCKKCFAYAKLDLGDVICRNLTESEVALSQEPAKDKEWKTKW